MTAKQVREHNAHAARCFLRASLPCDRKTVMLVAGILGHQPRMVECAAKELGVVRDRKGWRFEEPKPVDPRLLAEAFGTLR